MLASIILFRVLLLSQMIQIFPFAMNFQDNTTSIYKMNIQPFSITITGFHYHPNNQVSDWVDRVFGNMSVHYSSSRHIYPIGKIGPLTPVENETSNRLIREKLDIDFISLHKPLCSIDLLGSVPLEVRGKTENRPFTTEYKKIGPAVGNAILTMDSIGETWKCYYRSIYENWRDETDKSDPNFLSVFFYCPQFHSPACSNLNSHISSSNDVLDMHIRMELLSTSWQNSFKARLHQPIRSKSIEDSKRKFQLGICISNVYSSTDIDKAKANGKLFQEWIRYYSRLGIRIFIYDRDAISYQYISEILEKDELSRLNTVYYNYTMRGLLDVGSKGIKYDNNEMQGNLIPGEKHHRYFLVRFYMQGVDKVQTLTQCRFEAKAIYGIDHVIVADYDEFLYCPTAGATAKEQGDNIYSLVDTMRLQGIDQVTFQQRMLGNRTEYPRNCIIDKISRNESLFDCFYSYHYFLTAHALKSIHIGHKCPLTGYHTACTPNDMQPRLNDCICNNMNIPGATCSFIHISTNHHSYERKNAIFLRKFKDHATNNETNELTRILY